MENNKNNLIDVVNNFEKLSLKKVTLNELTNARQTINININELNILINQIENNIKNLEKRIDSLGIMSKKILHPIKTSKEKKLLIIEINSLKLELSTLTEKVSKLENERNELLSKIVSLKDEVSLLPNCFKIDEKHIVVTDDNSISTKGIDFSNNPQELMIHVTDFYPKNKKLLSNYDGNKFGACQISYKGVVKNVESLSHRHSVHFTINNVVESTGDGFGSWQQPKYIIVDSMTEHQQDNIKNKCPSDSWTYGSIGLSDKAILLVNKDYINSLPDEAYNDYKIVVYSGDYATCARNIILATTGKLYYVDENYPGHSHSKEYYSELLLNKRNRFINYIKDNNYKGKEEINFNKEELLILYEMMLENDYKVRGIDCISEKVKKYNVDENTLHFYYLFGFIKNQNGTFRIKNDEEIYDQFYNLDKIDLEQLNIINEILQNKKKEDNNNFENIIEQRISTMTIADLYKFENQKYAEFFYKKFSKHIEDKLGSIDSIFIDNPVINSNGQLSILINLYSGMNVSNVFSGLSFEKDYEWKNDYGHYYTVYRATSSENMSVYDAYELINRICHTIKVECEMYKQTNLEGYNNEQKYHK